MGHPAIKDIYQLCSNRLPSTSPLQKLRIWRYPSIRILAGRSANHNQLSSEPLETMGTPSHHVAPHLVFIGSRFENRLLFYHCGSCQQQRVHSLLHARLRLDILQIFNAVVTFRKKPEGSTQFKHKTNTRPGSQLKMFLQESPSFQLICGTPAFLSCPNYSTSLF